jgi:hypothetical protein
MRFFNSFKFSKDRYSLGLSPLALLTLAACGGGGGGGQSGGGGGSFSVGGNVIKGPLSNALVGLDYDGDGLVDSAKVRTGTDGSYSISTSNSTYTVIAVTDDQTVDASSGTVLSGITLKAPKGASVVTPTTTLMEEGGLTSEQVASVLGLPDGVDPTNFNPYASNVDADHALAVEKASQQVINVVNSFAAAAEGAGASEVDAFKAALNSVAEVVKTKANKINDLTASEADKSLDLTSDADLTLIKTQIKTEIASTANVNSTAFNTLADDTTTAIKNVNNKIETVTDLTSDASKNIFSTTQVLADQVKTAATAEVGNVGTGNISFTDANEVNTAAINKAPTNISLSSNSVSEFATSLVIGTLSTTDTDQSSAVAFIYKIAEVTGTDFSSFNINQTTGELSLLAQPDFETKASYNLTVLSTDEGGKTLSRSFIINVADVNEAPTVANAIADQTFAEDSTLNFQITSSVFKDADAGDSLTYTASLSSGANLPSWLSFDAATRTFSGTPDNGDVGAIDVMITATDGSSESVSDAFTITIANTNDAPTLANAISNQIIAEDSAFNFRLASNVFTDADAGDSLTYTASLSSGAALPSWLSFNAATQTFSGTPTNSDVGTIDVIATATDSGSQRISDTFSITITNTNDAPSVANAVSNQTFAEDSTFNFQLASNVFSDEDEGDSLSYAATLLSEAALPSWLSFNTTTQTFSGTPTNADVGAIDVMITATDGSSESVSDAFTITIANTNDAPTLANAISNQTIAEDSAFNFQLASNVFADVDQGDSLNYSATLASGADLPSWLSFNAATKTFTGTPANSDVGTSDVTVTATDSGSESISDTFSITITNTNDAPSVANAVPDQTFAEDSAFNFQLASNVFADVDAGDSLSYAATLLSEAALPSWLSFNTTTQTFSGTPTNADVGAIDVMITATDGSSESVSDAFTITIANTNDAPTLANAISNQTIAEDSAFNFQLASNVFADVDQGDSLNYSATLASGADLPSWLSFNAATRIFTGTPTNSDIGASDVTVTATDSGSKSISDTFSITITNTNDAPEITSTPATSINEDEFYSYYVFYRDVDLGDAATVSIESKPDWLNFDPSIRRLYGTPENNEVGTHSVSVKVGDNYGATGEQNFLIKVKNQNDAPTVANAISNQTIAENSAFNFQLASNVFTDVDQGDSLNYSATLASGADLPSWLVFDASNRGFSGSPTNTDIGTIDVKVTATDGNSASVFDIFSITVTNINNPPAASKSALSHSIRWDGKLTSSDIIYNNFSDPDIVYGDSLKYSIEMKETGSIPSWISINETTGILSVTPPLLDIRENPKTYQLDSYNSLSDEYSATDYLRLKNYFLTVSAEDEAGLTASADLVLAPEALFSIKTNSIEIKDYPKDKPATENILNTEINYLSDLGNVLTLSSFNLDNDNLQLIKDKNGSSWNTSTWPESPQLTFELATFDQSNDFGNLGEISIFLGQVLNASETNIKTIESEEKYIQLNFTGDSKLNTNGNLEFTFNPRLEGDIKYQSNASSLEASVSVSENNTLEFIPAENNEPAKLRVNILDLLDQLPFSGAVGALVPFEPGNFYVSLNGLPIESESGEFIDLIDAQFTIT